MPLTTPAFNEGPGFPIQFAADTEPFLRCYVNSSGYAAIAGADRVGVGFCYSRGVDISEDANGTLNVFGGYFAMLKAAGAITRGATCYAAAAGEVDGTGNVPVGTWLSATAADGDVGLVYVWNRDLAPITLNAAASSGDESNGYVDFVTGLGSFLDVSKCLVIVRSAAGLERAAPTVTEPTAGTLRVAHASLVETDVVTAVIAYVDDA